MSPGISRHDELIARAILAHPEQLGIALKERRWSDAAAVVAFARRDVSPDLAMTDPALYRELRGQVTRFYLRGGGALSLDKLQDLARRSEQPAQSTGGTPQ